MRSCMCHVAFQPGLPLIVCMSSRNGTLSQLFFFSSNLWTMSNGSLRLGERKWMGEFERDPWSSLVGIKGKRVGFGWEVRLSSFSAATHLPLISVDRCSDALAGRASEQRYHDSCSGIGLFLAAWRQVMPRIASRPCVHRVIRLDVRRALLVSTSDQPNWLQVG